jgi:hypothetical protein
LLEQALAWSKHIQLKDPNINDFNLASDNSLAFPGMVSLFETKPCAGDTEVVTNEANITSQKVELQNEMNDLQNSKDDQARILHTNASLGRGKRKAEHHKLNVGNFKRVPKLPKIRTL